MNNTTAQYHTASTSLTAVIEAVPADAWTNPSPCEGWSARDVVRHIIAAQREFLTGHGVDLGDQPDIDTNPAGAWRDHEQRVMESISNDQVPAIAYDGHFGATTVGATLEQFYIFDMVVHRWDIARAAGVDDGLTDAELDRIEQGADSFGEALYMDGVCRAGVEAPADADRVGRVLARLGRVA